LIDTPEQKGRITTKGPYRAGEGARIRWRGLLKICGLS